MVDLKETICTDLLPSGHPNSSSMTKAESVRTGQSVSWSIDKSPQPPSTVHGVVVSVNNTDKEVLWSGQSWKTVT